MNDLGLSKDLLKAASDLLKTSQSSDVNLQEKIRRDNFEGKRSASEDSFAAAYSSIVADERKKEAEAQALYAENAKKAHGRMGKSIVENTIPKTPKEKQLAAKAEPKDKITHKDVLVARGVKLEALQQLAQLAHSLGIAKRSSVVLDEQRESIFQIARTFTLSLQEVLQDSKLSLFEIHNITEDFRKALFLSTNVGNAVEKINELSKIVSVIKKHVKEPEAEKPAAKEGLKKMMGESTIEEGQYVPSDVHINPLEKFAKVKEKAHNAAVEKAKQMAKQRMNKEEKDTPGNGYEHQCAIHVKHAKLGEGKTLFSQHAEPAEDGSIAWYDVMFEHGIEKKVPTLDLEVLVSESHMNHKKRK